MSSSLSSSSSSSPSSLLSLLLLDGYVCREVISGGVSSMLRVVFLPPGAWALSSCLDFESVHIWTVRSDKRRSYAGTDMVPPCLSFYWLKPGRCLRHVLSSQKEFHCRW